MKEIKTKRKCIAYGKEENLIPRDFPWKTQQQKKDDDDDLIPSGMYGTDLLLLLQHSVTLFVSFSPFSFIFTISLLILSTVACATTTISCDWSRWTFQTDPNVDRRSYASISRLLIIVSLVWLLHTRLAKSVLLQSSFLFLLYTKNQWLSSRSTHSIVIQKKGKRGRRKRRPSSLSREAERSKKGKIDTVYAYTHRNGSCFHWLVFNPIFNVQPILNTSKLLPEAHNLSLWFF
jgi:hypothetical protein